MKKQICLVGTSGLSKKVQEAAFSVGYLWVSGDTVPRCVHQPFLLFDAEGVMTWDSKSTPADCQLEILQPCDIIETPSILCGARKPEEVPPAGYRLVTDKEKSAYWKPSVYAFFNFPENQWNPIERKKNARKSKMNFKWKYAVPVERELELIKKPEETPPAGYRLITDEEHKTCWKPGLYAWFCRKTVKWVLRDMSARTKNAHMLPGRTYALPVACELELIKKPEPVLEFPIFIQVKSKKQYDRIRLLAREPDFQPEDGDLYYWCCTHTGFPDSFDWEGDSADKYNYATGNVFRTEAQAQAHMDAVMRLVE